jgi:hypothetical protein
MLSAQALALTCILMSRQSYRDRPSTRSSSFTAYSGQQQLTVYGVVATAAASTCCCSVVLAAWKARPGHQLCSRVSTCIMKSLSLFDCSSEPSRCISLCRSGVQRIYQRHCVSVSSLPSVFFNRLWALVSQGDQSPLLIEGPQFPSHQLFTVVAVQAAL